MLSTSSSDGGLEAPLGKTRLIGSKRRDNDLVKYAFSKVDNDSFNAFSELITHNKSEGKNVNYKKDDIKIKGTFENWQETKFVNLTDLHKTYTV